MNISDEKLCTLANSEKFKNSGRVFLAKLKIRFGSPESINELKQELIDALIDVDPNVFN